MRARITRTVLLATLLAIAGLSTTVFAGQSSAFDRMITHYEAIRQSLLHDKISGIADHARGIESLAAHLQGSFEAKDAGVPSEHAAACLELLPAIREAASRIEAANTLETVREAFGDLSRSLIRYRRMTPEPEPVVAYCSMAKQAWLQPRGEIGNPYYGQTMARCGEVVSE